jgi:hypothetical protein
MFHQYVAIINLLRSRARIHLVPPEDHTGTVTQGVNKTITKHPLVLLDQQLQRLAKEDDDDVGSANIGSTDAKQKAMRCWKCARILTPEMAIDMNSGLSVEVLLCVSCGRRWHGGEGLRPVIAA